MGENSLRELNKLGQSVWLDYLSRDLIQGGELARMVEEDAVTGVTSNPTIFQKAISGSAVYDEALKELITVGEKDEKELFLALAMKDVGDACDLLRPVHEATGGVDGYVSIEVSPDLAHDTEATVAEARRLFGSIGRKNLLVKVPATREGLPAIEQLIGEGINVNVTLLFAVERYEAVMEAYLRGLEKRAAAEENLEVTSVGSFFVSRVDTLVDNLLGERLAAAGDEREREEIRSLMGHAAVANAKLAYLSYREVFGGERFGALRAKGARPQRILWASTSTKNPAYSDLKYIEELVAPDSVNTMPGETLNAFKDHGRARVAIEDNLDQARAFFGEAAAMGMDMAAVTEQLEAEGVKSFADSFFALLREIGEKRSALAGA